MRTVLFAVALLFVPVHVALAQTKEDQAASLVRIATTAAERGEHAVALAAFEQADALSPSVGAKLGAARALSSSGKIVAAKRRALEAVALASTTADAADDADGEAARALAGTLAPRVATLFVRVTPADATITIDGTSAEATRSVELDPGEHVAAARRAGFAPLDRKVRLADGERAEIELSLVKAAPPKKPEGPTAPPPPDSTGPSSGISAPPLAIVGFLGAVAGLAVGVPFGVATITTLTSCPDEGCPEASKDDAAVTGGVAIAGLSVFAVGLTVGIVTLVVDDGAGAKTAAALTCQDRAGLCLSF